MLAIRMLPGGHGDALVVEYGSNEKTYKLLIDGGTASSWDGAVKPALVKLPDQRFEALIVTHIDEDHIGGAIKIFKDFDLSHRVKDVWFNGYIHCDSHYRDDVLGPIDGERLTLQIREGGLRWNQPFGGAVFDDVGGPVVVPDSDTLPRIELPGGGVVHLLSPTQPKLDRLAMTWDKVVRDAGLTPGAGTDLEARPLPIRKRVPKPLPAALTRENLSELAAPTPEDRSAANGSSIAFIFEYEGQRALLGADAHPGLLVQSLHKFAKSIGKQRVPLDLVKLPHHGSKGNVSAALIEAIDAKRYLISSNGDNHGLPDHAAIARVAIASAQPPIFYCNYRTEGLLDWAGKAPAVGATFVLPEDVDTPGICVDASE